MKKILLIGTGGTIASVSYTHLDVYKRQGLYSGSAGGFIGYGSGVQISRCDVTSLKHTAVDVYKRQVYDRRY